MVAFISPAAALGEALFGNKIDFAGVDRESFLTTVEAFIAPPLDHRDIMNLMSEIGAMATDVQDLALARVVNMLRHSGEEGSADALSAHARDRIREVRDQFGDQADEICQLLAGFRQGVERTCYPKSSNPAAVTASAVQHAVDAGYKI